MAVGTAQPPRVPIETKFADDKSQSGVSFPWQRFLQQLQAQKPFTPTFVSATPYLAGASFNVILVTTGAGAFSLNLGPAKSSPFSIYVIVKIDAGAGAITIKPNGTDTVNGAASLAQPATQWRVSIVIPDQKNNWIVFSLTGGA